MFEGPSRLCSIESVLEEMEGLSFWHVAATPPDPPPPPLDGAGPDVTRGTGGTLWGVRGETAMIPTSTAARKTAPTRRDAGHREAAGVRAARGAGFRVPSRARASTEVGEGRSAAPRFTRRSATRIPRLGMYCGSRLAPIATTAP